MCGPTLGLTCAAGGYIKRGDRRHATRMKNAPGLGPRQRRQVQAMLGGHASIYQVSYSNIFACTFLYVISVSGIGENGIIIRRTDYAIELNITAAWIPVTVRTGPSACKTDSYYYSPYAPANRIVCYTLLYDRRRDSRHLQ